MKIYRTKRHILIESGGKLHRCHEDWDVLLNRESLPAYLKKEVEDLPEVNLTPEELAAGILAPIGSQEVWAAGVTYFRSREARMDESKEAGGGDFYDRVYAAKRPELFFKSAGWRVRGPGEAVRIRRDSGWNVPEPELTLFLNAKGEIAGYTIGNDVSSRDIEGENPLYLPQAKTYDGSAAIGPCVYVPDQSLPPQTAIQLEIRRKGKTVFSEETALEQIKRAFTDLAGFLYSEMTFPRGVYLMTGTGIIPPNDFTIESGDEVRICIPPIGTLTNLVVG